jgi:hypothetical protein
MALPLLKHTHAHTHTHHHHTTEAAGKMMKNLTDGPRPLRVLCGLGGLATIAVRSCEFALSPCDSPVRNDSNNNTSSRCIARPRLSYIQIHQCLLINTCLFPRRNPKPADRHSFIAHTHTRTRDNLLNEGINNLLEAHQPCGILTTLTHNALQDGILGFLSPLSPVEAVVFLRYN